jgi:heme/copper-type cytochrome/quinol oxidase subunit 2
MKPITLIAAVLTALVVALQRILTSLSALEGAIAKDNEQVALHYATLMRYLTITRSVFALVVLCLIGIMWKERLGKRWEALCVMMLWLAMVCYVLTRPRF